MPEHDLPKKERLLSAGVKRVFEKGTRVKGRFLTLIYLNCENAWSRDNAGDAAPAGTSDKPANKIAAVVSKRVSKKAVLRNQIKRHIKEAYRHHKSMFPTPYYLVFLTHQMPKEGSYPAFEDEMKALAKRIQRRHSPEGH